MLKAPLPLDITLFLELSRHYLGCLIDLLRVVYTAASHLKHTAIYMPISNIFKRYLGRGL